MVVIVFTGCSNSCEFNQVIPKEKFLLEVSAPCICFHCLLLCSLFLCLHCLNFQKSFQVLNSLGRFVKYSLLRTVYYQKV